MICSIDSCGKRIKARGLCSMHYYRLTKNGSPHKVAFKRASDGEPMRFLTTVGLEGNGCLIWPYAKNNAGYGQVNLGGGKKVLAHRVSCERRNGPPPSPLHHAAHSCGNGHLGCIAPWHLSWKTSAENNQDQDVHGTRSWGERHGSILRAEEARTIRSAKNVSQSELANRFGVTQSMISRIRLGKAWVRA